MALFDYTPDPLGSLMGTYYDPKVEQQRKLSGMLSSMGHALLNPDPHSKLGALGTIGNVAAAAGQGVQKAGTDYLAKAYAQTRAGQELKDKQREEDQKVAADKAKASYVAAHPELKDFILAFPDEAGKYIGEQMLYDSGKGQGHASADRQGYDLAVSQGYKGSWMDYKKELMNKQGGISIDKDGNITIGGSGGGGKTTQFQSVSESLYMRGKPALEILDDPKVVDTMIKGVDPALNSIPYVGNSLVSGEFQKGNVAKNDFLTAMLRKESGQAITESEQNIYGSTFFPVFGDKPDTLKLKSDLRKQALEGMRKGMSPLAMLEQAQKNGKIDVPSDSSSQDTGGDVGAGEEEQYDADGNRIN